MKKKIFLITLLLITLTSNVKAEKLGNGFKNIPKNQMTEITLKKVLDIPKMDGYGSIQGITATDKYFVIVARRNGADNGNALYVYNKSNYTLANLGTQTNPVKGLDIGHGNDLTYNSKTNKIIAISSSTSLTIINADTFQIEQVITISRDLHSITYDPKKDVYYGAQGDTGVVLDSSFNPLSKEFNLSTNMTRQGMSFYKGIIYRSCSEAGAVFTYEPYYEGILKANENVIYNIDYNGKLYKTWYIAVTDSFPGGEIEGVAFNNGIPHILYNISGRGELYIPNNYSLDTRENFIEYNNTLNKSTIGTNTYVIKNLTINTTFDTIINKIDTDGEIKILDNSNKEIASTSTIKTGDKINITISNTEQTTYLSIKGDASGDGIINTNDVSTAYQILKKKKNVTEPYRIASDTTQDGELKINDIAKLYQYTKNKISSL